MSFFVLSNEILKNVKKKNKKKQPHVVLLFKFLYILQNNKYHFHIRLVASVKCALTRSFDVSIHVLRKFKWIVLPRQHSHLFCLIYVESYLLLTSRLVSSLEGTGSMPNKEIYIQTA